ncbi:hypothetical protein [Gordonia liuliyuniae]|uniref:Phospho-glucose isomerase C-terminal SIS domain-containing protein n=1 Tax=Gordonia liuliyuniae TaxID=2911517 RepID=A0ABS9IWV7_9ACTN|nr:hypothetical protein [Gordonia liuliyuniae]MCF8590058.1 hypothetical protein [Gordonia liuliyuniae]
MSAHFRDLDDVDGLIAADRDGLLRSAATSGAHVRAVAHAVSEGVLDPLTDLRPRAIVVVTGASASARRAAEFVVALLAARVDAPLVVAPTLPGWIGPLDVVVAAGDDPGDRSYADAALRALRRRAEFVAAVPVEGPFADAVAAASIADMSPRLPADARFGFVRLVAVLVAVCTQLSAARMHPTPPALADVADLLDAEATAYRPGNESFHNQAKLLAMRADGRSVAWAGDTPAATALAEHVAATLFAVAGIMSAAGDEADILARLRVPARSGAATDSLFYDPDFDGPDFGDSGVGGGAPVERPRVMMLTTASRSWGVQQRTASFGDVDIVTEQASAPEGPASPVADRGAVEFGDAPSDLGAYLAMAVRADFAVAYLELTGAAAR